jgi:hypothetical protein
MYAKTLFLKAAATLPFASVNASYYTWLDLGCHEPMCGEAWMAGRCLDPSPWARRDRIRIAITAPMSPAVWAQDDVAWAKTHHVHMAGTVFGTSRAAAAALADAFADALSAIMAQGMLCYDQTIFALAFRRAPQLFDAFPVFFNNCAGARSCGGPVRFPTHALSVAAPLALARAPSLPLSQGTTSSSTTRGRSSRRASCPRSGARSRGTRPRLRRARAWLG